MRDAGMNLVTPPLVSCLRRNDDYTKGAPRRTPKGHLQRMRDAGMNLVAPPLDSCLRRNDGYAMVRSRRMRKAHLKSALGGMAGGWKIDQAGLGLAPQ